MKQAVKEQRQFYQTEFLFVLYYFAFYFVRPLAVAVPAISTYLLMGTTFAIATVYLCINLNSFDRVYVCRWTVFVTFIMALFFLGACFQPNDYLLRYAYEFLIYGLIPLFLLVQISNYEKLLWYWSIMAIAAGFLFCLDPFNHYAWTGNYMVYGINLMIPAFTGSVLLATYFHKWWANVVALFFFVEVVLFSNRTSILTAMMILVLGFVYYSGERQTQKWNLLVAIAVLMSVFLLRSQIINAALRFAEMLEVDSYALTRFRQMLKKSGSSIMGSRIQIWENAWNMILRHPILGNGIGTFETENPGCVHNVFLDIWAFGGMIGLLVFIFLLVGSIVILFRSKELAKRVFDLTMLMLWFVTMQFSLTLWAVIPFWVYFGSVYIKMETTRRW